MTLHRRVFHIVFLAGLLTVVRLAPLIQLEHGLLSGEDHAYYTAYRCIPYAVPPVGQHRFEPPRAYNTKWPGVRQGDAIAPKCLQYNVLNRAQPFEGSEDCLYLNVFVPNTPRSNSNETLPVMVFIHGGGFMWGSADFYGENAFMRAGHQILVTLNYRLGPFGFLSTEDAAIPGNMGLKDQAMALRWVHHNIRAFGGDRRQILLAGWSAGGASVHYHLVSAATSSDWFQCAASFSGTALCPCHAVYKGEALKRAQLLGGYLNCTHLQNTAHLKSCLQMQRGEDIVAMVPRFYEFANHPFAIFGPVIDGNFLSDHVANLMRSGRSKAKPWLIARTAEDGGVGAAEFLQTKPHTNRLLIDDLNANWLQWAPVMMFFNASASREERARLAYDLRSRYFGERPIEWATYKILADLFNTEMSTKHVVESVQMFVNFTSGGDGYGYVYDNPPDFGLAHMVSGRNDVEFGTTHGDDVFLLFNTTVRQTHPLRQDEAIISRNLLQMLARFAATRVPEYDGQKLRKLQPMNGFQFNVITKDGLA